jgi:hypothetical protein
VQRYALGTDDQQSQQYGITPAVEPSHYRLNPASLEGLKYQDLRMAHQTAKDAAAIRICVLDRALVL